ncbi:MAG: hypothetical protein F4X54_07565 [Chloroflexi bacterium]|nr:hypothetical protein [Chloroflexota bacterium]MYB84575.1 hypothetical protein [Chloroflexota bacterium]
MTTEKTINYEDRQYLLSRGYRKPLLPLYGLALITALVGMGAAIQGEVVLTFLLLAYAVFAGTYAVMRMGKRERERSSVIAEVWGKCTECDGSGVKVLGNAAELLQQEVDKAHARGEAG